MDTPSKTKRTKAITGKSSDSRGLSLGGRTAPNRADAVLWLIGTPIGNLGDLTMRAREALRSADALAAEDTRRIRKLLSAEAIATPRQCFSYRAENEARASQRILGLLSTGQKVALVSDAGMPAISDPGAVAVREALAAGFRVEVIPGVSAVTTAVALSGFGGKGFVFTGFAPHRKARIARMLAPYQDFAGAIVVFESPRRLGRMLAVAAETLGGNRSALVAFEMTKLHERVWRGTLDELAVRAVAARANLQAAGSNKERNKKSNKESNKEKSKEKNKTRSQSISAAKDQTQRGQDKPKAESTGDALPDDLSSNDLPSDDLPSDDLPSDDLPLGEATLVIAPAPKPEPDEED